MALRNSMPLMTRWSRGREVAVVAFALTIMCCGSAVLGWLLAMLATFRAIYAAAGIEMPMLMDMAGAHPWALLAVILPTEITVPLLAWRSRRPALWLTVHALALAGLVLLLMSVFKGNIYRPIYDLNAVLRSGR